MISHNQDGKTTQSTRYSWKSASVTVAGVAGNTDITGIEGFTALFTPFTDSTSVSGATEMRKPHKIKVSSSGAAYIKVNGGDVITIGATTPFEASDLIVNSLSVSTGGGAVTITVYLQ
jgi:hypothetical protein